MERSLFEQVGGESFFVRLVETFYELVEGDMILRPMYPEDLADAKRHLTLFLIQYWGGPKTFMQERGHPRLRLRHVPFPITLAARDAWLGAMDRALTSVRAQLTNEHYDEMRSYFAMAATQLVNE